MIAWWLDLQLHVQSVPITTKVESSNSSSDEVYSIKHYALQFVSDCGKMVVFSTNKTDLPDISEILLID